MSYPADIKINGVDVLNDYGYYVTAVDGIGPIQSVKRDFGFSPGSLAPSRQPETIQPRKLTIKGIINQNSNENLDHYIEAIGALVGWYNDRYREATITINHFQADGSLSGSGDGMTCLVVVESMDVKPIGPAFTASAAHVTVTFRVIQTINHCGGVSNEDTISLGAVYWEDTSALHGAINLVSKIEATSGTISSPSIYCCAISEEFTDVFGTATETGTHPVEEGALGTPALSFTAGGSNTLKFPTFANLPVAGTEEITIFIKFKRNFTVGDGNYHVLLGDSNGTGGLWIGVMNNGTSDLLFTNGTENVSVSGSMVRADFWNYLVCRQSANKIDITLKTLFGGELSDETASPSAFPSPGSYFWVGTASGGSYRSACIIDEVAIWKHPLSDDAVTALLDRDDCVDRFMIRDYFTQDLNKRLTFLLDFTKGFQAIANRGAWIGNTASISTNHQLIVDSDRRTIKDLNMTDLALTNRMSTLYPYPDYGVQFPVVERYNKWQVTAAAMKLHTAYMPLRRL